MRKERKEESVRKKNKKNKMTIIIIINTFILKICRLVIISVVVFADFLNGIWREVLKEFKSSLHAK